MSGMVIYHAPGACSRVVLVALEEIGLPYEDRGVALMRGAQYEPPYQAINPKGKVPVLVDEGVSITETPAILHYLADLHPAARLLPAASSKAKAVQGLSDVIWCGGTLHPMMHRIFRPIAYSSVDPDEVKARAISDFTKQLTGISDRLEAGPWWYGSEWSMVDVYMAWVCATASMAGYPLSSHGTVVTHLNRVAERPAFRRAVQREREAVARDGLSLPPGIEL